MNVGVPGEQSTTAFWVIVSTMCVTLGGLLYYFRKRGFL
jgi:Mg2+ and Co2+ transporter CorA